MMNSVSARKHTISMAIICAILTLTPAVPSMGSQADDISKEEMYQMILELQQSKKEQDNVISELRQELTEIQSGKPGTEMLESESQDMEPQEWADTSPADYGDSLFDKIAIHGFISQGYLKSTEHDYAHISTQGGSFEFNEIGLTVQADVTDKLRMGLQLFSYDFGEFGNNDIRLDWAFGDYSWQDWLGLRIGKLKTPYGLYNEVRDVDAARTTVFLPNSVYYDTAMRHFLVGLNGVTLYGQLPYGFSYSAQYGQIDNQRIKDFAFENSDRTIDDSDADNVVAGQLKWELPLELSWIDSLLLAYSHWQINGLETYRVASRDFGEPFGNTSYSVTSNLSTLQHDVFSLQYSWSDFTFTSEYLRSEIDVNVHLAGLNGTALSPFLSTVHDASIEVGWYGMASYRFTNWFEFAGIYSEHHLEDYDSSNPEEFTNDFTLAGRFDINDYWLVKMEVHFIEGLESVSSLDDNEEEYWNLFALKTSFTF